jgi:hypothetical protein
MAVTDITLKEKIFEDKAPLAEFANACDKSERQMRRIIGRLSIPVVFIGRSPYITVTKAKAILFGETPKPARGRPRKAS